MMKEKRPIIIIPARMSSTRLPGKPMALINNDPMIVHVWRRAMETNLGPVVVACDHEDIKDAVEAVGGKAVMTDPDLPSGTDRCYAALQAVDPEGEYTHIINLQGDLPTLEPDLIKAAYSTMDIDGVDIGTLVCPIEDREELEDPSVVKAVLSFVNDNTRAKALYFSRAAMPAGEGGHYHHIGIYVYSRDALSKFVGLPPSGLEMREKLEQLRALENGMRIDAVVVDTIPLGVDTPQDLEKAQGMLAG